MVEPGLIEVMKVAVRLGGVNQGRIRVNRKLEVGGLGIVFLRGHSAHHTPAEARLLF